MKQMRHIVIAGIGGVGGFLGAKLALHYKESNEIKVHCFTRKEAVGILKEHGLKLHLPDSTIQAHPSTISNNVDDFPSIDILILCCKTYHLSELALLFKHYVHPNTIILPIQNGVDSMEILTTIFLDNYVNYGCIYLNAKRTSTGVINALTDKHQLYFGNPTIPDHIQTELQLILRAASINAIVPEDIQSIIWKKFAFISPVATYTSLFDITKGQIIASEEHWNNLQLLMQEFLEVAKAAHIHLDSNCYTVNLTIFQSMPMSSTSSMQADFLHQNQTEHESLTAYIVNKAKQLGIALQQYPVYYALLKLRLKYSQHGYKLVPFTIAHIDAIKILNIEWLEKYFYVEPNDVVQLSDPLGTILDKKGYIFYIQHGDEIVATVSLLHISDHEYELGKMAVSEHHQGKQLGNMLIECCVDVAKELNIKKLILYSNTSLGPAIHLYTKYGFKEIPLGESHYKRSNIKMQLHV